jgi:pimeloyl-ACP methyl ester carboxylesterase
MSLASGSGFHVAAAIAAAAVIASGCGNSTANPTTAKRGTVARSRTPSVPSGDFTVHIGGRSLSAHCRGRSPAGRPTIALEVGQGNSSSQLGAVADALSRRWRVCSYDRAGLAGSDPDNHSPRKIAELLADEQAFLRASGASARYVLVGQSLGAMLDLLYMQEHPEQVAAVLAMNPGPTYHDWIRRLRGRVSRAELLDNEIAPMSGRGAQSAQEAVDTRGSDRFLTEPVPASIPYVVMFAEDCGGGSDAYCDKVVRELEHTQRNLARRTRSGRFIAVPGASHEIYLTKLPLVLATVEQLAAEGSR